MIDYAREKLQDFYAYSKRILLEETKTAPSRETAAQDYRNFRNHLDLRGKINEIWISFFERTGILQ